MIFFFLDFFKFVNYIYDYFFIPKPQGNIIWWPLEYNRPRAWFVCRDNFYDDIPSSCVVPILNQNPDMQVFLVRKYCENYTTYLESNELFSNCNNSNRMIIILDQNYCGCQNYLVRKNSIILFSGLAQRDDWSEAYISKSLEREIITDWIDV